MQWMISSGLTKQIELHIYPRIEGNRIRRIKFYDVHLVGWTTNFDAEGAQPLAENLTMTVGGLKDSVSGAEYTASWRVTYDEAEGTETVIEENEPEITSFLITDKDGKEKPKYAIGEYIYLRIKSVNKIGDVIDIRLNKKSKDFKYNNEVLPDDTLVGYVIQTDNDVIKLEVVKPSKK